MSVLAQLQILGNLGIVLICWFFVGVQLYIIYTRPLQTFPHARLLYIAIPAFMGALSIPYLIDIGRHWMPRLEMWAWAQAWIKIGIPALTGMVALYVYPQIASAFRLLDAQFAQLEHQIEEARHAATEETDSRIAGLLEEKKRLIAEMAKQQVDNEELREYINILIGHREILTDALEQLRTMVTVSQQQGTEDFQTTLALFFNALHDRFMTIESQSLNISLATLTYKIEQQKPLEQHARALLMYLMDTVRDGIFLVDSAGTMVIVNAAAVGLSGYQREELIGQPVELLVPAGKRDRHRQFRTQYSEHPSPRVMASNLHVQIQQKDGTLVPIAAQLYPYGKGDYVFVFVTPQ